MDRPLEMAARCDTHGDALVVELTAPRGGRAFLRLSNPTPGAWCDGRLSAPSSKEGGAIVRALAKWLGVPAGRKPRGVESSPGLELSAWLMSTGPGAYDFKLALASSDTRRGEVHAEVYLNVSETRAAWVEKEERAREDLITLVALALRDGPQTPTRSRDSISNEALLGMMDVPKEPWAALLPRLAPDAAEFLAARLSSSRASQRAAMAGVLHRMGDPRGEAELLRGIASTDLGERNAFLGWLNSLRVFASTDPPPPFDPLRLLEAVREGMQHATERPRHPFRAFAPLMDALRTVGPAAADFVEELAEHEDPWIQLGRLRFVCEHGPAEARIACTRTAVDRLDRMPEIQARTYEGHLRPVIEAAFRERPDEERAEARELLLRLGRVSPSSMHTHVVSAASTHVSTPLVAALDALFPVRCGPTIPKSP